MAYFIFNNNLDNIRGSLYRIAENQSDYNNLIINPSNYKIIEDSQSNFEVVKYGTKNVVSYDGNTINYENADPTIKTKELFLQVLQFKKNPIKIFLQENPNHPLYSKWNNYLTQLNNVNVDNFTFPMTISLETYFNNQGQLSLNPLQLP